MFLNNFLPNKTFLFEYSPERYHYKIKKKKNKNKYDKIEIDFHERVIFRLQKNF